MSLQTGTLQITGLRLETLEALELKAKNFGQTREEYARELLEDKASSISAVASEISETDQEARKKAADAWWLEWQSLTQRVSAAIPDGPSLVDTLIEMRR